MNRKSLAALFVVPFLLGACIQDELPNTECDIETVSLHFDTPSMFFKNAKDTLKTVLTADSVVVFTVQNFAVVESVPVTFKVTGGASIYMRTEDGIEEPFMNGSSVDFSDEKTRYFRIVSQDGMWSRSYGIKVIIDKPSEGNFTIGFDEYRLDATGKYYVWKTPDAFPDGTWEDGTSGTWKNGNPGYKISKSKAMPLEYPSTPVAGGGPDGSDCLKLETCDTGPFGKMVNMRIASGSLFNGIFDVSYAITDALKATQFGTRIEHRPMQLRVWLRYEPGSVYMNRDGSAAGDIIDEPDVYIVFFRNEGGDVNEIGMLDGYNVLTSTNIVGLGRLQHRYNADGSDQETNAPIHGITDQWQEFTIPVEYRAEVDEAILEDKGYSIIIGLASSWQGAFFRGAIGSKLYIDNMQLFCE